MNPKQLCKGGTEHGHQRALFQWCKIAEQYGFQAAWDDRCYEQGGMEYAELTYGKADACWPLKWFHAIPNGGALGDDKQTAAIRGGQKKAEGVKAGVYDTMLPYPQLNPKDANRINYFGLWLEMKKPGEIKGRSSMQKEFGAAMLKAGYSCAVADSWIMAAKYVQAYMEGRPLECPLHNAN